MTRLSLRGKIGTATTLMLAAALAAVVADAHELFSGGRPTATSALERRAPEFKIRGDLARPLTPGVSQPLNLRLTNPYRFKLGIKRLTIAVSVDARHAAAGCTASSNYRVTQLPKRAYPIRLPARRTRTLRALRVKRLPRVAMRNLPTNQDACKGARLKLRYSGRAVRWRQSQTQRWRQSQTR